MVARLVLGILGSNSTLVGYGRMLRGRGPGLARLTAILGGSGWWMWDEMVGAVSDDFCGS